MARAPSSSTDRPALDRAAIVAAALDLLDEVGLDGLSTRKLAVRLGVSGPSLYWHFRSMAELRDHMAEALLEDALPDPAVGADAWTWLASGAQSIRSAALSRRDGARLMAGARPTAARAALRHPGNLARLEAAGLAPDAARYAFLALARYAWGSALTEQAADADAAQGDVAFEFGLSALVHGLMAQATSADPSA